MPAKDHPDYKSEQKRFEYTKGYIRQVIVESDTKSDTYRSNIKEAMKELDYLDSSQSYINVLTNSQFLEMTKKNVHQLSRIQDNPYFCRIDFQPFEDSQTHQLYIGKTSLFRNEDHEPLIIDWRSPIASVYYDGRLGNVTYESPSGEMSGNLKLKRQYTIQDGELIEIRNIDLTARDELLQESLSSTADARLTDIIVTIQSEQNRIIRAEITCPLIVQGVAGSGKTTIALHRIAYFIYTYADHFRPDEFMILAPNKLFLNYISEVLPDLGVEAVNQTTFIDFVREQIGYKYKFMETDAKLKQLLQTDSDEYSEGEQIFFASGLKGSMMFKDICDAYLQRIERDFVPKKDLALGAHVLYTYEDIKSLFHEQYQHLALYQRVDRIKKVFTHVVKSRLKEILKHIEEKYDKQIEKILYSRARDAKRRDAVVSLMDEKDTALDAVKAEAKVVVKQFVGEFPKKDVFQHYAELLLDLSHGHSSNLELENLRKVCTNSLDLLAKKRVDVEDAAALLYLQYRLFGISGVKAKAVIIDEAQDFSVFQFFALKTVLNTELFTILGDLSQGIHAYRGVNDWQNVINQVFPNAQLLVLEQSYRTTVEIMEFANQVIVQSNTPGLVLAKPVVRHGDLPTLRTFTDAKELYRSIAENVVKARHAGMRSIAVIAKTMEECNQIKRQLQPFMNVQLLQGEEDIDPEAIGIFPVHISKGLEFDVVFVVNVTDSYSMSDLDLKLLYVACTRPLHKLYLYQVQGRIQPLQDIPKFCYNRLPE